MFNPNDDRCEYGKMLTPPDGYTLDFAVGTTYSLDLDALIGVCMSLGLGEETDTELLQNPVYLFDVLHRTGDKIALFCEGGQIHFPSKVLNKPYVLLEKAVAEIAMPKRRGASAYPSFHPKFWLIRYKKENELPIYRVVVLSRNLTFDHSWDVAFAMDGKKNDQSTMKNDPLMDFLSFLLNKTPQNMLDKGKKKGIKSLIEDLKYVHFDLDTKVFSDYDFIPIGIKGQTTDIRKVLNLSAKKYSELLVISPFLSSGEIKSLNAIASNDENANAILITRKESLAKLKPDDCDRFKMYCMRDEIVEGESMQSDGEEKEGVFKNQDIHAKVFLSRKYSYDSAVELFLGSMNASHNAVSGNIEFLIHLKSSNRYLNLSKFKEDLFGKDEKKNPFQEVMLSEAETRETAEDSRLDAIIKAISRATTQAKVLSSAESYDVEVTIDKFSKIVLDDAEVYLTPLFAEWIKRPIGDTIMFSGLSLNQLSSFYRISVNQGEDSIERIIIIPTEGIPDARDGAVLSSCIPDEKSFYQYLSFLLGDNPILGAFETDRRGQERGGMVGEKPVAVYEKMLEVAAREPSRFKEIDYLMNAVAADGVVPQGFAETYEIFKKVVKSNG